MERNPATWKSVTQIAETYGFSQVSVLRWITSGKLHAERIGGRWRISTQAWQAFRDDSAKAQVARKAKRKAEAERLASEG